MTTKARARNIHKSVFLYLYGISGDYKLYVFLHLSPAAILVKGLFSSFEIKRMFEVPVGTSQMSLLG